MIRLSLSKGGGGLVGEGEERPPLERVIVTKWGDVCIDWNGSEPIL